MSLEEDKYKKQLVSHPENDDESGRGTSDEDGGTGGAGSQVAFKDFLASGQHLREDLLPDELRRLLSVHQDQHELNVKKQKDLREQRKDLKEGKINLQSFRQGMGAGMSSEYRINPVLANKAQFSGIDRQVNMLPNENIADTNEANRNELENQYRLRYAPGMQPKFNPKPQFNR